MHSRDTQQLFAEGISRLKSCTQSGFPISMSYLSGFIAHYVIDRITHPLIYSLTKNNKEHKILEMKLDALLLNDIWGKRVHMLSPVAAIDMGYELHGTIVRFFKSISENVYRINIDEELLQNSYRSMKAVLSFFYSPLGIKRILADSLIQLIPSLSQYIYHTRPDYYFLTPDQIKEFKELINKGVVLGIELINNMELFFENRIDIDALAESFGNISFAGV